MQMLTEKFTDILNWLLFGRCTNSYLNKNLSNKEKHINEYRVSELVKTRKILKFFTFFFICSIPIIYYGGYPKQPEKILEFKESMLKFIPISSFFFILLIAFFADDKFKKIKTEIKKEFMVDIISSIFKNPRYEPKPPDDFISEIKKFSIVPSFCFTTKLETEDYIEGLIDNTHIKGCEVYIYEYQTVTDSDGKTRTKKVVLFKGVAILTNIKKNFNGYIEIIENSFFSPSFDKTYIPESLESVTLESPEFGRLFKVKATDQIQSRYILTPSFMMRVVEMINKTKDGKFNSEKIMMAFRNKQLLIMIPTENHFFEIDSVLEEITMQKLTKVILEDLSIVTQIIDSVELDNKSYS